MTADHLLSNVVTNVSKFNLPNLLYFNVPKTGTSWMNSLMYCIVSSIRRSESIRPSNSSLIHYDIGKANSNAALRARVFEDTVRFTVVRDPLFKFFSAYFYLHRDDADYDPKVVNVPRVNNTRVFKDHEFIAGKPNASGTFKFSDEPNAMSRDAHTLDQYLGYLWSRDRFRNGKSSSLNIHERRQSDFHCSIFSEHDKTFVLALENLQKEWPLFFTQAYLIHSTISGDLKDSMVSTMEKLVGEDHAKSGPHLLREHAPQAPVILERLQRHAPATARRLCEYLQPEYSILPWYKEPRACLESPKS